MSNIKIVKLINNTTLIGIVEESEENILISYPMEITSQPVPNSQGLGEVNMIRPYMTMTDEREIIIDKLNVVTYYLLSEHFFKSYNSLVEQCYFSETDYSGSFIDDTEEENEELFEEEEVNSNKGNKTLH